MACHGLLTAFLLLLWLEKLWFILSSMTSYILWTMVIPSGSDGKESICNKGDMGSIPGLGRDPGGGNGHPLQYSGLENSMNRGAWQAAVHGFAKSQLGAQLCIPCQDFPCSSSGKRICLPMHLPQETWVWSLGGEEPLEEEIATHSSIFVWRIPWTKRLLGLQSVGLQSQTGLNTQAWRRRWRWSFSPDDSTVRSGSLPAHRWELGGAWKKSDVRMRMRQQRGPWMDTHRSGCGKQKEETGQKHSVSPGPHHSWAKSSPDSADKRWNHPERDMLVGRRAGRRVRGYTPRVPALRMEVRGQESK